MLVKLIASSILLFASGAIGYLISLRYSLRVKEISTFIIALNNLEAEILYYSNSLPLSMKRIAFKIDSSVSSFFLDTYESLSSMKGYTIEEAWKASVLKNYKKTSLTKEDIQIIIDFGKDLGIGNKEIQKNYFIYTKNLLEEQRKKAKKEKEVNSRLYNRLGFLIGLVIVIILI